MSEVQSRPSAPRGRGSSRGGRGGFGSRGGARTGSRATASASASNGPSDHTNAPSAEDEGEVGELKKKYSTQLATVKELFPDWTNEDVVYALQENNGDLEGTIEKITEGSISQWGEVKKKTKDRSRSKVKDGATSSSADVSSGLPSRGGRGGRGGQDLGRGGRGRGSDRGRAVSRAGRGGSNAPPNGHRSTSTANKDLADPAWEATKTSVPTDESSAWGKPKSDGTGDVPGESAGQDGASSQKTTTTTASERPSSSVIPGGTTKSWASMFARPTPPPAQKKAGPPAGQPPPTASDALPPPVSTPSSTVEEVPASVPIANEPDTTVTPSKDALTETNLEQVLDTSGGPATETAASTVATSRGVAATGTPFSGTSQAPASRPPTSGYAATAFKATGTPGRSSSFQRRVLDQQEAVVMPGNHAVDRAAVQFGSLGLNGGADDGEAEDEKEEMETRAQPPQHSPVAQTRTTPATVAHVSLPAYPPSSVSETEPTPRQAPGLPAAPTSQQPLSSSATQPASAAAVSQGSPQTTTGAAPPTAAGHPATQGSSHPYGQFNRYAQQTADTSSSSAPQKPYDPFGQPPSQQQTPAQQQQPGPYDGYPSHSGQPQHHQGQSHLGAFSSAPTDYSSYYTSDQQRGAYQNYYNSQYGQQGGGQNQPDVAASAAQRGGSGYGGQASTADATSPYPGGPTTSRFPPTGGAETTPASGESGHSTPNPTLTAGGPQQATGGASATPSQTIPGQGGPQPPQQQQPQGGQQQQQTGGPGSFPYGHPYYSSPYYTAYMNQVSQGLYGPYGSRRTGDAALGPPPLHSPPPPLPMGGERDLTAAPHVQFGYGGGAYNAAPYGGGGGGGKGAGMYGHSPHQNYGISPQSSYDQHAAAASSPANIGAGGFGQQPGHQPHGGRDGTGAGAAGGIGGGEYGRTTGSAQPGHSSGAGGAFGGVPDVFGRSSGAGGAGGFQNPNLPLGQHHGNAHGPAGGDDGATKGYGGADASKTGGPSPLLNNQSAAAAGGRPGSAANNTAAGGPGQSAGSLPQSQQAGFGGGYPSHLNQHHLHGSQQGSAGQGYGSLGGLGGAHQQQAGGAQGGATGGGYGQYGSGYGGSYYGGAGSTGRGGQGGQGGGWGGNYGH